MSPIEQFNALPRYSVYRTFELRTDDNELNAISVCSEVLEGLQAAGAKRVLDYLQSKIRDPDLLQQNVGCAIDSTKLASCPDRHRF